MSDSEVNRLKTGAFTFGFETLPPSSCLCHLTLLVLLIFNISVADDALYKKIYIYILL